MTKYFSENKKNKKAKITKDYIEKHMRLQLSPKTTNTNINLLKIKH